MSKQIRILHHASSPTIGGVEATIAHHARGLANLGYQVTVLSGSGGAFDERVETIIHPLFGSRDARILQVKRELDAGFVSDAFHRLVKDQKSALMQAFKNCDVGIIYNIHTLKKNLPLTATLADLSHPRLIGWAHDIAWTNPQYLLHQAYPWNLLSEKWVNSRYVTVSDARRDELADLLYIKGDEIAVVTAGIDIAVFMQWTASMIEEKLQLLNADMLFLLPARITRRKNIEYALRVLHELKQKNSKDYRLIVTGPPNPHNPGNMDYLGELLELRNQLGLQNAVHFLYELTQLPFVPDEVTMANLYQIAEALLFPSIDEGLGIPVLEAGLVRLPTFCSNLEPFYQTGQVDLNFFDPQADTPEKVAEMINDYFVENPRQRLKTRIRQEYRWENIVKSQLVPLLEEET